jgi:hypothetical protein
VFQAAAVRIKERAGFAERVAAERTIAGSAEESTSSALARDL